MDSSVMDCVVAAAVRNAERKESDYIGEDGLLYCGICNTRKQTIITLPQRNPIKVPVVCKCEREKMEEERKRREYQEQMDRVAHLRQMSLMDNKFREATFENFRVKKENEVNFRLCRRYARKFDLMMEKDQGLLFYGAAGGGKSFAAACIANYLMEQNVPVVMTSFIKLLDIIQRGGEQAEGIINLLNDAKLVILDDLGAERGTEYALEKVYDIVDSRYRRKLPMLLTTNLTLDEMKEETDIRYVRIYDRIFEVCYPMRFEGISWRRQQANSRFLEMRKILGED